ncbi:MAG: glycosyltransferase [Lachnospiraceae bacterium]
MKIAYFTPLNPMHSGVSDWAEELLPYMKGNMEIDIYVDQIKPENEMITKMFSVFDISEYEGRKKRVSYDLAIFQAGNSFYHNGIMDAFMKYGGVLEIHDISMHNYLATRTIVNGDWETYEKVMKTCHGIKGEKKAKDYRNHLCLPPWEEEPLIYTVTKIYIDRAEAVIVHSDFARQIVKGVAPKKNVYLVPLHTGDVESDPQGFKQKCRRQLDIEDGLLVFGSFGMATPHKRIVTALRALSRFKIISSRKFHYYIVGQNKIGKLEETIDELGLHDEVTITGRIELDQFKHYMGACDIAFNLRYPTQGESSASLQRLLGYGKAIIVTDIDSFKEYPDDFMFKVRYDRNEENDLLESICKIVCVDGEMERMAQQAVAFVVGNFALKEIANRYKTVLNGILDQQTETDYIEELADYMDEFGININQIF